jgi:hypothetical protein
MRTKCSGRNFAFLLTLSLSSVIAPNVALAKMGSDAMHECDQLAADPDDPARPKDVPGVDYYDLKWSAVDACTRALTEHPDDVRLNN